MRRGVCDNAALLLKPGRPKGFYAPGFGSLRRVEESRVVGVWSTPGNSLPRESLIDIHWFLQRLFRDHMMSIDMIACPQVNCILIIYRLFM